MSVENQSYVPEHEKAEQAGYEFASIDAAHSVASGQNVEDEVVERVAAQQAIEAAKTDLTDNQRKILNAKYSAAGDTRLNREVARELDITPNRVSQVKDLAAERFKKNGHLDEWVDKKFI